MSHEFAGEWDDVGWDLDAEIDIMRKLEHDAIIRLFDVVASSTSLYILLELVRGGDLFQMISRLKHYSGVHLAVHR